MKSDKPSFLSPGSLVEVLSPAVRIFLMIVIEAAFSIGFSACKSSTSFISQSSTSAPTGKNVMQVTVDGGLCSSSQYANEPCVSVTLCESGTSHCQTIDNILLDTGSYGLRVFSSVVSVSLTPVTIGSSTLAECVQFGDGSSEWGQVEYGDVVLAQEPAVKVPIELIDSSYATPPSACTSSESIPDTSPLEAGFNGILGVGLFNQDCGSYCSTTVANGQYYACSGDTCAETNTSVQVQNPVALVPSDNNGVVLELPPVGVSGASSITGSLTLGIGTQSNNSPSSVSTFAADDNGEMKTVFSPYSGGEMASFIDSGSSVIFLPSPASGILPDCNSLAGGSYGSAYEGLDCPSSDLSLSAVNKGSTGSVSGAVSFQVRSAYSLYNSGNAVFSNLAGGESTSDTAYFDWGLPFFFGRKVYVGLESTSSSLGTGPYWAY